MENEKDKEQIKLSNILSTLSFRRKKVAIIMSALLIAIVGLILFTFLSDRVGDSEQPSEIDSTEDLGEKGGVIDDIQLLEEKLIDGKGDVAITSEGVEAQFVQVKLNSTVAWANYTNQVCEFEVVGAENTVATNSILPGSKFELTFDDAGEYAFECQKQEGIFGAINVY